MSKVEMSYKEYWWVLWEEEQAIGYLACHHHYHDLYLFVWLWVYAGLNLCLGKPERSSGSFVVNERFQDTAANANET